MERATFGAGCFWCVEEDFRRLQGVVNTRVGFMGGHTSKPSYKDVCTGTTGHAEVVDMTYDPLVVSYDRLLEEFWSIHDPTALNRQGPDVGTQYRSVIFFYTPDQESVAKASKDKMEQSGRFQGPVVTEIVPAGEFYVAEDYHQQYMAKQRGEV